MLRKSSHLSEVEHKSFRLYHQLKKMLMIQISQILGYQKELHMKSKTLVPIIDGPSWHPDIRKIINTCQLSTHKGELKIDTNNVIEGDLKSKLVEIFVSKDDKRNKYMKIG